MGLRDRQIDWMRKREFRNSHELMSVLEDATSGIPKAPLTGTPTNVTWIEMLSSGCVGVDMVTTEVLGGAWLIPYDLDPKFDIGISLHYIGSYAAAAPVYTWTTLVGVKKATAWAVAATALDTPHAAQGYLDANDAATTTDGLPQVSPRGILTPKTHLITHEDIRKRRTWLTLKMTLTVTNTPTYTYFLGAEFDYVPQRCEGSGSEVDRPLRYDGKS